LPEPNFVAVGANRCNISDQIYFLAQLSAGPVARPDETLLEMRQTVQSTNRPSSAAVLVSVVATFVIVGIIAAIAYSVAVNNYRTSQGLPDDEYRGFFGGTYRRPADVSFAMLGWGRFFLQVLLPVLAYWLVHPLIGRTVVRITRRLAQEWDRLYSSDVRIGVWHPNVSVIFAAVWPLTIWAVPFLAFGVITGRIYRSLWS
jgi:hypothetical protein